MKNFIEESIYQDDQALRARDGIVAGGRRSKITGRERARATWVLVARGTETVEDFFLESPFGADDTGGGGDPVPWICRGVDTDGTLRIGAVDLSVDRFVSDDLSDDLDDQIREALRRSR
jgi:hypothetical protein